jgi:hypothetical protein
MARCADDGHRHDALGGDRAEGWVIRTLRGPGRGASADEMIDEYAALVARYATDPAYQAHIAQVVAEIEAEEAAGRGEPITAPAVPDEVFAAAVNAYSTPMPALSDALGAALTVAREDIARLIEADAGLDLDDPGVPAEQQQAARRIAGLVRSWPGVRP